MSKRLIGRLRIALVVLVLAGAAALVGVNVYLNSEYLPRLVKSQQESLTLEYTLAWTVWPGRLHLEGVKVRGDERALSWEVQADRAKLVADLSALAGRRLQIDELTLSGVSARIRPRLHYLDASPEYLAVLPKVPSAGPDFIVEGPEPRPEERQARAPWALELGHVEVKNLQDVWVDRFRFVGKVNAEGSVTLAAGRVLATGPITAEVEKGTLSIDGEDVVHDVEGKGTTSLGAVDLNLLRGVALLGTLSGEAALKGEVANLKFVSRLPGLPVPIEFVRAEGPVTTRVTLTSGKVQPGTELTWEAKGAAADVVGFRAQGDLRLRAVVADVGGEWRTRCTATMTDFSLGREGAVPFAEGADAVLALDAPNVDLARAAGFDVALAKALEAWPGQLAVKGVRARGQERALEWEAKIAELTSHVDLAALKEHRLVFARPITSGVRVRIRPRLASSEATPAAVKFFPAIGGFKDPPLRTAAAPTPILQRAVANPWAVTAVNATVQDLQELWVADYRWEGSASAKGGFLYEPGGRLSTGPITADLKDGTLAIAKWKVASKLKGSAEATVLPFDLQQPEGFEFFRALTARADVEGHLDDVDFVRHYPAVPLPVVVGGGEGPVRAQVALKEGVVQAGSVVHYETRAVQASTHGYRFVGPFSLDATWADAGGEPKLRLEGRVSPYKVTKVGSDVALVGGKLATVRMDVPKFDLARPTFEPFTTAQVQDGQVYDLRVLNEYVPADLPLKMEAGAGTFSGRVAFTHKGQATAELKVGGKDAKLVYDKVRAEGDWSIEAKLSRVNLETGEADVDRGLLVLDNMAMREGAHARDGWFGRVEMVKGHVRPLGPVILEGDVETTMRDGRPLVAFMVAETDMLPAAARSLLTLQALRATARFRLGLGFIEVDTLNARGQSMELRGRMRKKGEVQWADMLVSSRGQDLGLALRGQRVEFKLMGAAAWYREQMLDPKW